MISLLGKVGKKEVPATAGIFFIRSPTIYRRSLLWAEKFLTGLARLSLKLDIFYFIRYNRAILIRESAEMATTMEVHRCEYEWQPYCGARVCWECEHHHGMIRCYCGWSINGNGSGYQELLDMGEQIESDY